MINIPLLLQGLAVNVVVVIGGIVVATCLAFASGLAATARSRWLSIPARIYIETFRGSSALVQLYWVFYALPLLLGVRLSPLTVGISVVGLNIGAYGAEVVRGAVQSVASGQSEAAVALGMSPAQRTWRITLPQAVPAMLPPFGNLAIELLKASSLVSFVTLHDVMWAARIIRDEQPQHTLLVYLIVTALFGLLALILARLIRLIERPPVRRALGRAVIATAGVIVTTVGRPFQTIHRHTAATLRRNNRTRLTAQALALIAIAALFVFMAMRINREWNWPFTAQTVLPALAKGLGVTILATLIGTAIALTLGMVWAVLRPSRFIGRPISAAVEAIRSTPLLVQLFLVYYGLLPALGWNIPAFLVGSLLLGLHYSCYTAEVYRAGIEGVPKGQLEAARALSFSTWDGYGRIIIPQAVPRSVPALGNYIVAMFKETPLLSTITVVELLGMAEEVQSRHFRDLEAFTLVGLIFLVLSLAAAALIRLLEHRLPVRHA